MKLLLTGILLLSSLTTLADIVNQETCAKRYIEGSTSLVSIAQAYNDGEIDEIEYSARVTGVDALIAGLRLYCVIDENRAAQECVDDTKPTYTKIRKKMYVREVIKGNLSGVEVSELDLAPLFKGAVKGFFKKLIRGEAENICNLN